MVSSTDVEYEYQTFHVRGSLTAQRETRPTVVAFMEAQGYREAWADVMINGVFLVFKRIKKDQP